MSDLIKTGKEICCESCEKKWIDLSLLREEIKRKRKEYPCTTSSECIENLSAKEVFAWLLTLLEEKE